MPADNHKLSVVEQIEACRPGSDDLCAAEFAPAAGSIAQDSAARRFYESVQRVDGRLAQAFAAVPVPAGLAERLLAQLEAAPPSSPEVELATFAPAHPSQLAPRRWALRIALAASLLAMIGGGLVLVSRFTPYSSQQCVADAARASAQLQPQGWRNLRTTPAPTARLPKTRVLGVVKSWQPAPLLGDGQAVAFRFANGATLLVCQPGRSVASLPIAPPAVPQQKASASSGTHVAAWTDGGLVHVLLVNGPIEEYRRMTGTTRPVVALARPQILTDRYDG